MLQIYSKRKIHLKTVDTPTATLIVAVLVETYGNETHVSEPKIVRIISKNNPLLGGSVATSYLPAAQELLNKKKIVSPFVSFSSFTNSENITWLFARPPTK